MRGISLRGNDEHRSHSTDGGAHQTAHEARTLVRFVLCGSVDDGKNTLIGRLLYESQAVCSDQVGRLTVDSRTAGTVGDGLDFAPLLDGLSAERAQGITIDVAYKHLSTEHRDFIIAMHPVTSSTRETWSPVHPQPTAL
jgi:bifunctional enzyme CysN/CysC